MKFYITTAIPYPNGAPHLGFALEILHADAIARYYRAKGDDVHFLTGTDEHGLKVYKSAQKEGMGFQEYVDTNSREFAQLKDVLSISYDDFIRTSDKERHWPGAQKLWLKSKKDIYLKKYSGLYCVGCEAFVTEKELVDGVCPEHKIEPEKVEEENYFFKLSNYKKEIEKRIQRGELRIVPESRKNEILNLLHDAGDFSISRPREKISWGIPVPDDPDQMQYVWYDALANYITALGYGRDDEEFKRWWPADIHVIGKGVLRFHAIYWPAMLLSAGLPLPKAVYAHGYLTVEGEKISKSLGTAITPERIVKKYGVDAVRYFLLREVPSYDDGDFSEAKLIDRYNGDLANNLGNLVSRIARLVQTHFPDEFIFSEQRLEREITDKADKIRKEYEEHINDYRLHDAASVALELATSANRYIDERKPWKESPEDLQRTLTNALFLTVRSAELLYPFIPDACRRIFERFGLSDEFSGLSGYHFVIKKGEAIFPRLK